MKLILESWRQYLTEEVKFRGILMIKPTPELISQAKQIMSKVDLPPEAKMLKDAALHITLVHQSLLKPYKKQLKNINISVSQDNWNYKGYFKVFFPKAIVIIMNYVSERYHYYQYYFGD